MVPWPSSPAFSSAGRRPKRWEFHKSADLPFSKEQTLFIAGNLGQQESPLGNGVHCLQNKACTASASIAALDPDCHTAGVSVLTNACANLPLVILQNTEQYPSWPVNISTSQRDPTSPKWKELKRQCISVILQRFTCQIPQPLKLLVQVTMAPHISDLFPVSPLP